MARLDKVEAMIRRYGRKTLPTGFEREMVSALRHDAQGAIARGHMKTGAVAVWRGGRYALRLARRRGFRWVVRTAVRRLTRRRGGSPRT